ncbi:MAG: hypothetical protein FWB86_12580, partial [Treponema sp.]|nr:hypothetical protein [Treponema sp.]
NPPVVAAEGGAAISANGTVTMNNYALLFYKFPEDTSTIKIADYDYIDITYTLSNIVNSEATIALPGTHSKLKVQIRDYKGADAYTMTGGNYQDLGGVQSPIAAATHRIQTWGDNGTGGFCIRMNSWDVDGSAGKGDGSCAESIDIKIDKIEFSKGTRATVDFYAPQTPNLNNVASLTVLVGNPIGSRIPALKNPGWTFLGWNTGWDVGAGKPNGTSVGAATAINSAWVSGGKVNLYADWLTGVVDPITVNNPVFTLSEGCGGAAFITYDGTNDWILIHSAAYDISAFNDLDGDGFDISAISTAGTSRISYLLPTNAKYLNEVTLTYDAIFIAGDLGAVLRNNSGATSGGELTSGNNYPEIMDRSFESGELATGITITRPASAFYGSGYFALAKNNPGAYLIRITKLEVK